MLTYDPAVAIEGDLKSGDHLRETATGVDIVLKDWVLNVESWTHGLAPRKRSALSGRRYQVPAESLARHNPLREALLREHFERVDD